MKQKTVKLTLTQRQLDLMAISLMAYEDILFNMEEYGAVKDNEIQTEMRLIRMLIGEKQKVND